MVIIINHKEKVLLDIIIKHAQNDSTLAAALKEASSVLCLSDKTLTRWWTRIRPYCPASIAEKIYRNRGKNHKGHSTSDETKQILRTARLNQVNSPTSPDAIAKRINTMRQRYASGYVKPSKRGYKLSSASKERIREGILSKRYTPDYAQKLSLSQQGEKNSVAVLTNNQVLDIVRMFESGFFTKAAIAEEIGVSRGAVSDILLGRTWTHLTGINPRE